MEILLSSLVLFLLCLILLLIYIGSCLDDIIKDFKYIKKEVKKIRRKVCDKKC